MLLPTDCAIGYPILSQYMILFDYMIHDSVTIQEYYIYLHDSFIDGMMLRGLRGALGLHDSFISYIIPL